MWRILKAELDYHKRLFAGFVGFVILLGFYAANSFIEDLSPNYILFLMMFLLLQNWNTLRNKERRDFQIVQLPVSIGLIALARIVMIFIVFVMLVGPFTLMQFLLTRSVDYIHSLIGLGIILMGFSIYYIMRDQILLFLRKMGITQSKMRWGLAVSFLALNFLGIFFFIKTSKTGSPPVSLDALVQFIRFIKGARPQDLVKFFVPAITFACLTVISFSKRRSYFE